MKKILLTLILGMFLISFVSAIIPSIGDIGEGKQGDIIILTQLCDTCTYVNLTQVIKRGGDQLILLAGEFVMTKSGNNFNFSFNDTNIVGKYEYTTCGDLDGVRTCRPIKFEITPSGKGGIENIVFFVFVILMLYGITFFGFFGKNIPITILGGMAMLFLGVYIIQEGLIIYRDTLTIYFSYLTIAIGFIMAMWAILEQFEAI